MKGIILAGGLATRLRPLTLVSNKHLLPVYNKPMIYYAVESMKKAGVTEVLITSSPKHCGQFINLLKSGFDFGLNFSYAVQDQPGGIPDAIMLGQNHVGDDNVLVILGDNIFNHPLDKTVKNFDDKGKQGATVFGVEMNTKSGQYGVIEINQYKKVLSIEEKPKNPKSNLAQTGIYIYDNRVFSFIKRLKPSKRGELEVTDLNNIYLNEGTLNCEILKGLWVDAGTSHDELLRANIKVAEKENAKS